MYMYSKRCSRIYIMHITCHMTSLCVRGRWIPWCQALRARVESFGAAALAASPEAFVNQAVLEVQVVGRLPADGFMSLLTSEELHKAYSVIDTYIQIC